MLFTVALFNCFISKSLMREHALHGILSPPSSVVTTISVSAAYLPLLFLGQAPACMFSIGVLFLNPWDASILATSLVPSFFMRRPFCLNTGQTRTESAKFAIESVSYTQLTL